MRLLTARRGGVVVLVTITCLVTAVLFAQQGRRGRFFGDFGPGREPEVKNVPYDGRFTFARLRFTTGPGGYYYRGLPAWAHGYNHAETNLTKILNALTTLNPRLDGFNVLAADDPQLAKFPVAYMTEAGYWVLSDKEAEALRAWLRKGGFLIVDDFRDDFRSGGGWGNFADNMRRILPGARIETLAPSHPIFHSFFEIDSFDVVPQYYDRGQPVFRAIFEDNDPSKRIMVMINFNTDISNYWEFADTGFRPVGEANEAYKLGVNYIIYGMTH
jgi:hypothetical protein